MTLTRRSLLLIVPVVFLSYIFATLAAYQALKNSVRGLEQSRLDLAVSELANQFNQYSTFADSYLQALIESTSLKSFITEPDHRYRDISLGASIENMIKGFEQTHSDIISVLLVDPANSQPELYYFELSEDPFAELTPGLRKAYQSSLTSKDTSFWSYIPPSAGKARITISRKLDKTTLKAPTGLLQENSFLVQLALEPSTYLSKLATLQQHYAADVSVDLNPIYKPEGLYSSALVGPDHSLNVSVPNTYLEQQLSNVRLATLGASLAMFLFSSYVLYRLIRKYITGPVEALETELSSIVLNQKENLEIRHPVNDEIGRLERAFHKIYGQLSLAYRQTKELSEHDPLTKLYNLRYLTALANEAVEKAKHHDSIVAFIYIDLDNFKFVNDKYGHELGDELLKTFAKRLADLCKEEQLKQSGMTIEVGRIAGDEFTVIIANPLDSQTVEHIASRILELFKSGFEFELGRFPVSASIGISVFPDHGKHLSELISNADNAMYQAKSNGKNQVALYSAELGESIRRRMAIEQELKSLDPDQEFFLVYMPLVRCSDMALCGFEVLVRWISPKLGFVGPDEFVPIAENCGLFDKIDHWVCSEAISQYATLRERLGRDYKLSINLSSAQLNMSHMGSRLLDMVEKHQVPTNSIQLEMTETLNVELSTAALQFLKDLKSKGFQIAIDDFGTGHTALLQLVEYPANMIKFDKNFVEKALASQNASMLEPLVELCHSQGHSVTIEGVETAELAQFFTRIGADYLQGYVFGKPCRLEELDLDVAIQMHAQDSAPIKTQGD